MKKLLHKLSGRKWKPVKANTRWGDNAALLKYFNEQISMDYETGYPGALRAAIGNKPVARGVSVGAGTGHNERALVKSGLVEHFDLYEVSADRIRESRECAAREGQSENFTEHLADALEENIQDKYDLVLWDSSLHHMFDVDRAMNWSVRALKPGGHLLISEYIGPTRLQWRKIETRSARKFLRDNIDVIEVDPKRVRRGTLLRRYKQFLRDPSEAPQSDLIPDVYEKYTGEKMIILGGSAIHLCGGFLNGLEDKDPTLNDRLIALDAKLRDQGIYHFGVGLWRKPMP